MAINTHVAFRSVNSVSLLEDSDFGAQSLALLPNFLRLAHVITDINSRFATDGVVSTLSDRISTC